MRKAVMLVSLAGFVSMSAGFLCRVRTNPAELVPPVEFASPTLPWLLSSLLIIVGIMLTMAALILYTIYFYREERAKERQLKRWGMDIRSNLDLLRCKAKKARPYKREFWLQLALIVATVLFITSSNVVGLMLPQIIPPPSGPYTPENFIMQQVYAKSFPQIELTYDVIFWSGVPASIFICTFLSKNLAKKSVSEVLANRKVVRE